MADLHEVVFRWPYAGQEVILTGTFDQWSRSIHMIKGPYGFEGTVRVPWSEKVAYKFIVDGRWALTDQAPTESDGAGNTNNIYHSPAKPPSLTTINERPTTTITPTERPQEKASEPPTAIKGILQKTPAAFPPLTNGTSMPVSPGPRNGSALSQVEKIGPVTPPISNGNAVVPIAPVPQVSPPAETPAKQLPGVPLAAKPIGAVNPAVGLPAEPQVITPKTKIALPIVPLNDSSLVYGTPITTPGDTKSDPIPSTHTPPINSPRRSLQGPSPPVPAEGETKANGTNGANESIRPSTSSSPPTTPRKHRFPSWRSDSPIHLKDGSSRSSHMESTRSKRHSFIHKLKKLLTPEKHGEHKESHRGRHKEEI